jgi:hypothetical protein
MQAALLHRRTHNRRNTGVPDNPRLILVVNGTSLEDRFRHEVLNQSAQDLLLLAGFVLVAQRLRGQTRKQMRVHHSWFTSSLSLTA